MDTHNQEPFIAGPQRPGWCALILPAICLKPSGRRYIAVSYRREFHFSFSKEILNIKHRCHFLEDSVRQRKSMFIVHNRFDAVESPSHSVRTGANCIAHYDNEKASITNMSFISWWHTGTYPGILGKIYFIMIYTLFVFLKYTLKCITFRKKSGKFILFSI